MSISAAHEQDGRASTQVSGLSRTTIAMHWVVGIGVLGMLAYGFWLQTLPTGPGKTPFVQTHKSFGLLVFAVALARLAWRWQEGLPEPASDHRSWERRTAFWTHVFLIAATLLMPISGIVRSLAYARPVGVFGIPLIPKLVTEKSEPLYTIASTLHDKLALVLAAAIVLHVAAALFHEVRDRDTTLLRMFGAGR